MFTIDILAQPQTLTEAAEIFAQKPDTVILGGCAFLKMGSRHIVHAMDLSDCGLNRIQETNEEIILGAMTTLRDVETS
jgi:CO/xanthine dehydrogenase FAD-binding subunit